MKLPQKIGYKIYFFFFTWIALGELSALLLPSEDVYVYYHTLKAFITASNIFYLLAVIRSIITLVCVIPLFIFAFNLKTDWRSFYKPLLAVRIIADIMGHNYEWLTLKSLAYYGPTLPLASLAIWGGIFFLSYKAHFLYVFPPQEDNPR